MGTIPKTNMVSSGKDILAGWDPRVEDYLDSQSSTINCDGPGANFSRTANLARCKESVREPRGLYVRNVPLSMTTENLNRLFSEFGKVLSVFIGKPKMEFLMIGFTWAIVKVGSMRDAMSMIAALDHKPPMLFKVELAMTGEERDKRRKEKGMQNTYEKSVDELAAGRSNSTNNQPSPVSPQLASTKCQQVSVGRGKMLSLKHKENEFACGQPRDVNINTKQSNMASAVTNDDSAPSASQCQPRGNKGFVEMSNGTVAVGWKQPRPCIFCRKDGKLRCSVCKAWYCSKACQVDDWYYHRDNCVPPPPLEEPCNQFECVGETEAISDLPSLSSDNTRAEDKESILTQFSASYFCDQTQESPQETVVKASSLDSQQLGNIINNSTVKESHEMQLNNFESVNSSDNYKLPENFNHGSNMQTNPFKQRVKLCGKKNLQQTMSKLRDIQKSSVRSNEVHEIEPELTSTCSNERAIRFLNPMLGSRQLRRPFHPLNSSLRQMANDNSKESAEVFVSSQEITDLEKANAEHSMFESRNLKQSCQSESAVSLNEKMPLNKTSLSNRSTEATLENLSPSSSKITSLNPHSSTAGKPSNGTSSELMESLQNIPSVLDDLKLDNEYEGIVTLVDSYKKFTTVVVIDGVETVFSEAQEVLASVPYDPTFKPVVGSRVAAVSSFDNSWCRAYVYKIEDEKFHVCFVDFGNVETVNMVKPLPAGKFLELQGLATIAKLHAEVGPEIQQQLQNVITVDNMIRFKVVGKKPKSLKVSLLHSDSDSVITDFILRPWYTALPLLQDPKVTMSRITPGLLAKFDMKNGEPKTKFSQDNNRPADVASGTMNSEQTSSNSACQANLSKHTGFVPHSAERSMAFKSLCQIGESSKSVSDVNDLLERLNLTNLSASVRGQNFVNKESLKVNDVASPLPSMLQKTSKARQKFWARDLDKIELKHCHDYKVLPVSVDDENQLYLHVVTKKSVGEFKQLMESIAQHCATGTVPSDMEVGELVFGFVVGDGLWYRGEVVKVATNLVTLYLVDFGNEETLLKNNVKEFSANFMQFPCACVKVKLHKVSKDDSEAHRKISELIKSSLQLIMYCPKKDNFEFQLFDPQKNVLLNDEFSSHTRTPEFSSHTRTPVHKETLSAASFLPITKPPQEDITNPPNRSTSLLKIIKPQSSSPEGKSFHKIGPLSPIHFLASKKSSIPTDSVTSAKQKTPEEFSVEAQRTPRPASNSTHSMTIKSICNPSSASKDTPSSTVKLSSPKAIVQQDDEPDNFVKSTSESEGIGCKVLMYDKCKSTELPIAKGVEVIVLEVSNASSIFVIPRGSISLFDELEDMTVTMTKYCESRHGCLYRPKIGEMCLGKFSEDGKWYRAACLEPRVESAFVIFVDFANVEELPHSNIRPITESFLELPCLALHCLLHGVSENVKEAAEPRLRELLPAHSAIEVDVLEHHEDGTYTIAIPKVLETLISEDLLVP